jgi:predicted anti-sigma-YlaC factor YlaD
MAMLPEEQAAVVVMHCKEVRRKVVEHFDEDLDPETAARVIAHLEYCNHCAAIYDGVRNVVALLGCEGVFEPRLGSAAVSTSA